MRTYRGTEYAILRQLARRMPPSLLDCRTAEREARCFHANGWREHAAQALLIARALWSAYRYAQTDRA